MNELTMRERMLAVVQGREHDRVPFVQYSGIAAPDQEVWSLIGRGNLGVLRWSAVHRLEVPHCRFESEEIHREGRRGLRTTLVTPAGALAEERFFEPVFGSSAIRDHYVRRPEDYHVLMAYLRDVVVVEDIAHAVRDQQALGDDGLPLVAVARTPYQQLWVQWVSLNDLCLHLADCPDLVEECISLLGRIERDIFAVVRQAAAAGVVPMVDVPDNITAPTIGEAYFRRYCVPFYDELAGMLAEWEIPVFVHMDGDLKPLWNAIGASGVRGLDSFSPPPDNDTRPADAVALWPEMRLWLNFPSSVHLAEPEAIYQRALQILEEAGHTGRLQIQVSENVPPGVWRRSYPAIVRAIAEYGRPL